MSLRIWVTRDEDKDGALCAALQACDLTPVLEPVLERRVLADALDILAELGADDWLVLTSPYAITAAAQSPHARVPRVALVGEPSRKIAESHGLRVELVSQSASGKSLFAELHGIATAGRVVYLRSSLTREPKPWGKVSLDSPVLYETVTREFDRSVIDRVDGVAVASPSAVSAIGPLDLPFASIGPTTTAALKRLGIDPWVEAPTPSFDALASVIAEAHGSQGRGTP